jgi:hypothetical protein
MEDYNKIIGKVAREIFKPYGIKQKGKSRLFIDDNGWFMIIIEFQPSYSKGTYLNIGINFNWRLDSDFSFDIGYREHSWIEFKEEKQFSENIIQLCKISLDKILKYRSDMQNIKNAETIILKYEFHANTFWGNYHRGIISGLNGNINNLNEYFNKLLAEDYVKDELENKVKELQKIANDNITGFTKAVTDIIKETRKLKKLEEKEIIFE